MNRIASIYDNAAHASDAELAEVAVMLGGMRKADLEATAAAMGHVSLTRMRLSAKSLACELERIVRDRRGVFERNNY